MTDDKWPLTNENRLIGLEKVKTAPEGAQGLSPGYLLAERRYFGLRENQRNPVTTNSPRFRIRGQRVPVLSTERLKQPQSMLKPRAIADINAMENVISKIVVQTNAPLSQRPTSRQMPTHSSKAGRKRANPAVTGHGVS